MKENIKGKKSRKRDREIAIAGSALNTIPKHSKYDWKSAVERLNEKRDGKEE